MREILFRAQDAHGVWHKGFYFFHKKRQQHILLTIVDGEDKFVEIIPETVGQLLYTDKKNNNYFNGDIFEHNYYPDCLCRVYFSEDLLAVVGQIYDKNGEYELVTILPSDFENKMKLVGSVHENNKN